MDNFSKAVVYEAQSSGLRISISYQT
jgi:hypothetical protein